jgi:hypothetical protein
MDEAQSCLDELMALESAAERWPQPFTAIELRRAAHTSRFQNIHKGRKRFVTERELMEWLHRKKVGASCHRKNFSKSAASGLGLSKEETDTAPFAMTAEADR